MLRPDSLDLGDKAEAALQHFISMVDRKLYCLPFFSTQLYAEPPEANHCYWDSAEMPGSWVDAVILLRLMTGSEDGLEVERQLKGELLSHWGEDGLRYHKPYAWDPPLRMVEDPILMNAHSLAYVLNGLVTWFKETGDAEVKGRVNGVVKGLLRSVIRYTGPGIPKRCYWFPADNYTPSGWQVTRHFWNMPHTHPFNGAMILALTLFYEETGDEEALELAEGLSNYVLNLSRAFGYDGGFIGHTHGVLWTVSGILKYGLITQRREVVEWAKQVYDFAVRQSSSFGWIPELMFERPPPGLPEGCETCTVENLLWIAVLLAKAGYEEYWGDVERITRNQLVESQLTEAAVQRGIRNGWVKVSTVKEDTAQTSYQDVAHRAVGGFASRAQPNDYTPLKIEGCCDAMGSRALYIVWDNIVRKTAEGVYVNLLLSRDSPWVEVVSYHPYEGKVEVNVHEAPTLFIRVPEWAQVIQVHVDDQPRTVEWAGLRSRYIRVQGLQPNQRVTVTHTMMRKRETQVVAGREYLIDWKGDTITRMWPEGGNYPLYQREHMNADKAPMIEKKEVLFGKGRVHLA